MLNPSREGELKLAAHTQACLLTTLDELCGIFVRYGFGTASGIKFQFKHENINMSGYYANNAELAQMNDLLMDEEILKT